MDSLDARFANVTRSRTFRRALSELGLSHKRVLDIGCGYGEYLAHFGPGSVGITTTDTEVVEGTRRGLDVRRGNAEALQELPFSTAFEAVWANNLFEHLLSPHAFLMRLRGCTAPDATIVLGVPVVPILPFLIRLRPFRGTLASNHISFYTAKTLALTVAYAGWKVVEVRSLLAPRLVDRLLHPFAPHIYIVAKKDPAFVYPDKKVKEWEGEPYYADMLALGGRLRI